MKSNIDLANEWFLKSENDLLTVENNLNAEKIPTDTVCFHSQQAAEKYLKGYLIYNDVEFEFVHDMLYLVSLAIKIDPQFESKKEVAKKLDKYAVKIRYP